MIVSLLRALFGNDRNVLRETVEVFRENAEAGAERSHRDRGAALAQFAAEFRVSNRSAFDRLMDGLNRLPRPLMAFATLGLLASAMVDPEWFVARMQGLAVVPEPLWWLLGVIVSFYFGARHQAKSQEFQEEVAKMAVRQPDSRGRFATTQGIERPVRRPANRSEAHPDNPALGVWLQNADLKGRE